MHAPRGHAWVDAMVLPMGQGTPGHPGWERRARAILWEGDRIVLVGTDGEVRAEAQRRGIEPVALDGKAVLPGFVDAHTHFLHVGVKSTRPDLRGSKNRREVLQRLARWLAAHPGSSPVIGEGWDESEWQDRDRPTRAEIDAVVAQAAAHGDGPLDRPVVLRRICGHVAVASSGALPAIRRRWDDDAAVDPRSGLLLEAPSLYLNEVLPSSPQQLDRAVQDACAAAHQLGVTAVGDYSQAPYRMALQRAAAGGSLSVRVSSSIYVQQLEAELAAGFRTGRPGLAPADVAAGAQEALESGAGFARQWIGGGHVGPARGAGAPDTKADGASMWLRDGGLKVFLDGSLGGRTAYLREPYLDLPAAGKAPDAPSKRSEAAGGPPGGAGAHEGHGHGAGSGVSERGSRIWSDEELDRFFGAAHAGGVQVHAHAIGDAAIDQGLDAFERLARGSLARGSAGRGWAVERLDQDATVAPAQPGKPSPPGKSSPPVKSLRHRFEHFEIVHDDQLARTADLGIVSSSQPNFVGEWSARGGMYEARLGARFRLNNRFRAIKQAGIPLAFGSDGMPFGPLVGLASAVQHPEVAQRLGTAEAAWHYTTASAWSIHWEDAIGSLRPGHLADMVVLPAGFLEAAPQAWQVLATVAGGVTRFTSQPGMSV